MSAHETPNKELRTLDADTLHMLQLAGWIGAMPLYETETGESVRRVLTHRDIVQLAINGIDSEETRLPVAS